MTATYDPETDTFYQGIGNAGPDWDPEYRPGDNKWAASVLALNPTNGKIKWGYQYTPNDPYDYDEISEHPIINAQVTARTASSSSMPRATASTMRSIAPTASSSSASSMSTS